MKFRSLKDKFKPNIFVRPLYRNNNENQIQPIAKSITVDIRRKLQGRGFKNVKIQKLVKEKHEFARRDCDFNKIINITDKDKNDKISKHNLKIYDIDKSNKYNKKPKPTVVKRKKESDSHVSCINMNVRANNIENHNEDSENVDDMNHKHIQTYSDVHHNAPITWLRVYPAPELRDEGAGSLILRCVVSQLGLIALLVVWTLIWWIVINYFEEPYEERVTEDYEKEQNQLIIDLATELRQITQHSSKWRPIIEQRIQQERILTLKAAGRGAKLNPGAFWDLSGTFLFTVFVMTALGFGAPVPQTVWGRTSAIIYAALAAPTHLYLMMNLSTCIVFNLETFISRCHKCSKRNNPPNSTNHQRDNLGSRNSDSFIKPFSAYCCRRKIKRFLSIFCVGRCIPLSIICYYAIGSFCFGYLREQATLDIVMFPCLFTTTGGLETVKPLVRILYGIYVEGALLLVAIGLAVLKFHNNDAMDYVSEKYRLYMQCNYVSQSQRGEA